MLIKQLQNLQSSIADNPIIITLVLCPIIVLAGWGNTAAETAHLNNHPFQDGTLRGTVTDARTGDPLPGANILLEGTTTGASANADGMFEITGIEPGSYTVLIRFIGYSDFREEMEIGTGDITELDVALRTEAVGLDELVVTATGSVRAREIGTSQARITSEDFGTSAAGTPEEVLAGRISGATVLSNSGQPGAGGTIRLRGNNSISQGNRPIIYIDGIRVEGGGGPSHPASRQRSSPLNDLNPNDIERIDVVKGAAATTLYGTEASGGVIQIQTKQGLAGFTRWTANVSGGFNNIGHVGPRDGNPTGFFIGRCRGDGLESYDGVRFEDAGCPSGGSWLQNGLVQRYSLSVASGIENFSYYLSANFKDEEGVIHDGGGTSGIGFRGNFRFTPLENVAITFNSSYTSNQTDWIPSGNNADSFVLNVTRGPGGNFSGAGGCENPDVICVDNGEILRATNRTESQHFINSLVLNVDTGERLSNRITVGYDYNISELEETQPFGYTRIPLGQQTIIDWNKSVLSLEYLGTYRLPLSADLNSTLSWGGQIFRDESRTTTLFSENFSGPQDPTLISGARTSVTGDTRISVVTGGVFGQAMLDVQDRLFITAGLRVDGHSAFGDDFGLQAYPKVSLSYVLSDYEFWPVDWWNTLRLRAAVGESGQAPGAFDAVRTWSPIAGEDGQPGFTPNQIGNPDLGPERSREIEAGFFAGFLDGRINMDLTYYYQNTYDALIPVPAVASEGFLSSQMQNIGHLRNSGIEVDLDVDLLRSSNLNWNARFGYSKEKSEAIDLGHVSTITVETFGRTFIREGYPVPSIFGTKVINPDEIADPVFEEDRYYGPAYPDESIKIGTTLQLRQSITIDALGEFMFGGYMVNGSGYQNSRRGIWPPCYEAQRSDRSTLTARERAKCALDATSNLTAPGYDAWIESTDFFKLRHISVNFQLPQEWLPGGVNSASVNLAARNLFTITDYSGTDPELDDYRGSLARRDYYSMPTYRTFIGTLNFTF